MEDYNDVPARSEIFSALSLYDLAKQITMEWKGNATVHGGELHYITQHQNLVDSLQNNLPDIFSIEVNENETGKFDLKIKEN